MLKNLTELIQMAKSSPQRKIAVASADDEQVLKALKSAMNEEIITPVLIGSKVEIEKVASTVGFDLNGVDIINTEDGVDTARVAVELVRSGEARVLMKGRVSTSQLLKAVLDKDIGLRTNKLLSHVALFQSPYYHKVFGVTDVAMNIAPDLNEKVQIIQNATRVFHLLGIENPKVAVAAAVEVVNPKMEATLHAASLKEMNQNGELDGCIVDGPFALDIAFNREAALNKGIESSVAGDCDILLAPDIEAGNMFYKSLNFLGGAHSAAVIMGATAPIVLTSRSDDDQSKLLSVALAACLG